MLKKSYILSVNIFCAALFFVLFVFQAISSDRLLAYGDEVFVRDVKTANRIQNERNNTNPDTRHSIIPVIYVAATYMYVSTLFLGPLLIILSAYHTKQPEIYSTDDNENHLM